MTVTAPFVYIQTERMMEEKQETGANDSPMPYSQDPVQHENEREVVDSGED